MSELAPILTADSITRVGPEAAGAVVVNGSHGGIYAAYLGGQAPGRRGDLQRCRGGARSVPASPGSIICRRSAFLLRPSAMMTARIGDGSDMMARGVITHANDAASRARLPSAA